MSSNNPANLATQLQFAPLMYSYQLAMAQAAAAQQQQQASTSSSGKGKSKFNIESRLMEFINQFPFP